MIELRDYSGFKIEDFRYNKLNDNWAKLAIRITWILLVILGILGLNSVIPVLLTPFGNLFFSFTLCILGFIATFSCTRSVLYFGGKRKSYMVFSFITLVSTYIGYLRIFYFLPLFLLVEVNYFTLIRTSILVILICICQLCFTLNPQERKANKVISAMTSLLMLAYDVLWFPQGDKLSIIKILMEIFFYLQMRGVQKDYPRMLRRE